MNVHVNEAGKECQAGEIIFQRSACTTGFGWNKLRDPSGFYQQCASLHYSIGQNDPNVAKQ